MKIKCLISLEGKKYSQRLRKIKIVKYTFIKMLWQEIKVLGVFLYRPFLVSWQNSMEIMKQHSHFHNNLSENDHIILKCSHRKSIINFKKNFRILYLEILIRKGKQCWGILD